MICYFNMKIFEKAFDLLRNCFDGVANLFSSKHCAQNSSFTEYKTKERTITEGDERFWIDNEHLHKDAKTVQNEINTDFDEILKQLKDIEDKYDRQEVLVQCVNCKSTSFVSKHAVTHGVIKCRKCNGGLMVSIRKRIR